MNDEMNEGESALDKPIRDAIRDVPPVDPGVRERHIAMALAELSRPDTRSWRRTPGRWSVAAAVVVLMAGAGFALGRATSNPATGLAGESGTSVAQYPSRAETPVKGDAADSPNMAGAAVETYTSPCDNAYGLVSITRYQSEDGWRIAYLREAPATALLIVDEESCTILQEIDLP